MARPKLPRRPTEDDLRAQELYKYFRPPQKDGTTDPVLTAYAQLVAWRLDAQRSMITLIDEETQYFVAESTKTLHLDDANKHDHPDDAIWAGCVKVSKSGRLCEHTIAASPPDTGGPPCFEILDLPADVRFKSLDFVAGPPYFKNYAGVPLRTRKGVNIGSIFVIDSRIRPALTPSEKHFLGGVADNVVQHLEMTKDKKDCQRALNMSKCMSAYVDPLHRLAQAEPLNRAHSDPLPTRSSQEEDKSSRAPLTGRFSTFKRAAYLLLSGFGYDESGGGVMFLDTPLGGNRHHDSEIVTESSSLRTDVGGRPSWPYWSGNAGQDGESVYPELLAHACLPANDSGNLLNPAPNGIPSSNDLCKIIQHYPEGKLFTFTSRGYLLDSSSDEDSRCSSYVKSPQQRSTALSRTLATKLRHHFPKARQLIVLPLWDSSTSRWTVCIAYHDSKYQSFSYKSEFVFCATFGNLIIAELTKLASQRADQQKGDFIASISHELRSPLHGILASCEFLHDTELSEFQQSLVDTADTCARTLLDTINMVLDYSNINSFEITKDRVGKEVHNLSERDRSKTLQTSLSTRRTVDLAALVEEVIVGLVAGHNFTDRTKRSDSVSTAVPHVATSEACISKTVPFNDNNVEVVLDIAVGDWTHNIEPGALRRIVMNLVGNSLKFTKHGFVHIKMEVCTPNHPRSMPCLVMTITDSGDGISPSFLRDNLFSPFSQETTLTQGTGLGLSLVRSIVRTMGGKISITSNLEAGTRATVKLPLRDKLRISSNVRDEMDQVCFDNDAERERSLAIRNVKAQTPQKTGALHWHTSAYASGSHSQALRLLQASLATYMSRWFGLSISPWQEDSAYDIVISTSDGLSQLKQLDPNLFAADSRTIVLAVSATVSPASSTADALYSGNIVPLLCPFGPSRLAQALKICLNKMSQHQSQSNTGEHQDIVKQTPAVDVNDQSIDPSGIVLSDEHLVNARGRQDEQKHTEEDVPQIGQLFRSLSKAVSVEVRPTEGDDENPSPACVSLQVSTQESTSNGPSVVDSPAVESMANKAVTSVPNPDEARPRMLLVDDNTINLRLLQVYSRKLGHTQTYSAENGKTAIEIYERLLYTTPSLAPQVILMDMSMPVIDGFEATRRIREIELRYNKNSMRKEAYQQCFIVALTGLSSLKDQKEAFAAGVDRYMMKPVNFGKLSLLLEQWQNDSLDEAVDK